MFGKICKAQKCIELCILKLPFQRLVREIYEAFLKGQKRWKLAVLLALQEASKDFMMEYFNDLIIVAAHAHQITVMDKDSNTVKRMRWRVLKRLLAAYGSLLGDHSLYDSDIKSLYHHKDILEVSQTKSLDNAPLFLDIGDFELMLAFGEAAVLEEMPAIKMEELAGTREEANVDAPAMVEEVLANRMEELGDTREEAKVGVPPVARMW
ncbi:hypothetical protein L7F22_060802 [Adiantum nelumboides]|nr:hypothetical protein [Adiantum nelumboides]